MRTPLIITVILVLIFASACAKEAGAPEATLVPSSTAPPRTATITATPTASPTGTSASGSATPAAGAVSTFAPAPDGASVTISAVGDVSLARQVVEHMQANGAAYPYELIAPLMTGDIGFANLEGALTDRGEAWPKGYNFRTPPQFASGLLAGRFNIVSLANNHAMDYAVIGLQDTFAALDAAGVQYAGAGTDHARAWEPVVVTANGLHVAFVACALSPTEGGGFDIHAWAAELDGPGLAVCEDAALRDAIARARQSADFVVVAPHAGTEYNNTPDATQRALAEIAMTAGADAYIGAHAHVVQPIELRGNQLIAWGLGNFIFDLDEVDLANIPEPRVSLILNITLTKGQGVTAFEAIPVTQDASEDRPRPATPDEAAILQDLITP
jgi:poly-gamma-glutamate capsule biosynthesis protein CapA/YwtB (metallophosphatase superfamily)